MNFEGLFGMLEMEKAALRIVLSNDGENKPTYPHRMENSQEMDGFCHLIEGGFLESCGPYNGMFKFTDCAVERLNSRGALLGAFQPQT